MKHVYTSLKPTFLEWHEFVLKHGSLEEQMVHATDGFNAEKAALYTKWIEAEQIMSHKTVAEDGTETVIFDNTNVG